MKNFLIIGFILLFSVVCFAGTKVITRYAVQNPNSLEMLLNAFDDEIDAARTVINELSTDHSTTKALSDELIVDHAILVTVLEELSADHATNKTIIDELSADHATTKTLDDELILDHAVILTYIDELSADHATTKTLDDELISDHAVIKTFLDELETDHGTFRTVVADLKTLLNNIRTWSQGQVFGNPSFAINTNFDVANALAFDYSNQGYIATVDAANVWDTGTAATIATARWATGLLSVDGHGPDETCTVTWETADGAGYATEAEATAALASLPDKDTAVGYISVLAGGATWTAGTDALEGGAGGTASTDTNYYNMNDIYVISAAVTSSAPEAFGAAALETLSNSTPATLGSTPLETLTATAPDTLGSSPLVTVDSAPLETLTATAPATLGSDPVTEQVQGGK